MAIDDEQELKPGSVIQVNGRKAVFLYARGGVAIVRYAGERASRVVSLRKVSPSS